MLKLIEKPTLPPNDVFPMGVAAPVSHGTAAERLAVALRKHVGRDRAYSIEQFRLKIGASASLVEKMRAGESTPGLAMLLTMLRNLPPQFANDLLELAGLTGARKMTPAEVDARRVQTDAARFVADISQKFEDGRLDHAERADLRQKLPGLIAELQSFHQQLGGS